MKAPAHFEGKNDGGLYTLYIMYFRIARLAAVLHIVRITRSQMNIQTFYVPTPPKCVRRDRE